MLLIYHVYKCWEGPLVGHFKCLSEQQVSAFSKAAFHFVGIAFTFWNISFTCTMEWSSPLPIKLGNRPPGKLIRVSLVMHPK
jgi:hypothetical protein